MIKIIAALFLIAHGLVHLLWFVVFWQQTDVDGLPYSTKILPGPFELGTGGMRVYGLPCHPQAIYHACLPARTIVSNLRTTGILALFVGLAAVIWLAVL